MHHYARLVFGFGWLVGLDWLEGAVHIYVWVSACVCVCWGGTCADVEART